MEMIKVLNRPLVLYHPHEKDVSIRRGQKTTASEILDKECSRVRYVNHRFIDFEKQHEDILTDATNKINPDIIRISKILSRLNSRKKRFERSTKKELSYHQKWITSLNKKRDKLKTERNSSQIWKDALGWDKELITVQLNYEIYS